MNIRGVNDWVIASVIQRVIDSWQELPQAPEIQTGIRRLLNRLI